jgi:hypothetical protein
MILRMLSRFSLVVFSMLALFGCGGGGGGGGGTSTPQAVVTLGLQGTLPPGTSIGGVDVVVNLPAGVTAQADATGETLPAVAVPSGNAAGALLACKFTAAAAPAPGTLRIALVIPIGFTTGDLVTLNLDFSGAAPAVTGFGATGLKVIDTNGAQINGLTASLALQIK